MTNLEAMKKIALKHYEEVPDSFIDFVKGVLYGEADWIPVIESKERKLIYMGCDVPDNDFSYHQGVIQDEWGTLDMLDDPKLKFHRFYITAKDEGWDEYMSFLQTMVDAHHI